MARLLVLVLLLGLLWWGFHWFRTASPPQVAKMLRRVLVWGGIGLLVLAVVSGRLNPIFAAIAAAVPALMRLLNLLRMAPLIQQALGALGLNPRSAAGTAGSGQRHSRIRTKYLEMTLDQVSGEMDGQVLDGPFAGERLSALTSAQLERMMEFYQDSDAQSAAVLRAYLERLDGADHRARQENSSGSRETTGGRLSREEASAILGIEPRATSAEIREAHRRLMQKFHPDRGGSDYLAAKINEAKQRLLDEH